MPAQPRGVNLKALIQKMKLKGAPAILAMLLAHIALMSSSPTAASTTDVSHQLDFMEMFAGMKSVTNAFKQDGCTVVALDKTYGHRCDINTPLGFLHHLHMVSILKQDFSVCMLAPVCSTWVKTTGLIE